MHMPKITNHISFIIIVIGSMGESSSVIFNDLIAFWSLTFVIKTHHCIPGEASLIRKTNLEILSTPWMS